MKRIRQVLLGSIIGSIIGMLLLSGCSQAAETPGETTTPPSTEPVVVTGPEYGGIINIAMPAGPPNFDPAEGQPATEYYGTGFMYEKLTIGDWTRGPAGTGESSFTHFWNITPTIGHLAVSWERPDLQTVIWHIRTGVRFQDVPPVNGREMTADDVVYSIERVKDSAKHATYYGNIASIEATDNYTVLIKLIKPDALYEVTTGTGSMCLIVAREVVEEYGDLKGWESAVGTGPWILTNYIEASSLTLESNPDYWHTDPLVPGNRLPYADGINAMIIPENSSRVAAMRTGRIDLLLETEWQDMDSLRQTSPELQSIQYPAARGTLGIMMRDDVEPFSDKRVRQALTMAIDQQAIIDGYLHGNGIILNNPIMQSWGETVYTPLEKLPADIQQIYSYNPERARELLAEAGYPEGFQTQILTHEGLSDAMSLVKSYWAAIGVDAEIVLMDMTTLTSEIITFPREWEGVLARTRGFSSTSRVWQAIYISASNWSTISDPHIDATYDLIAGELDPVKRDQIIKELNLYALDQSYYIEGPSQYFSNIWQPWVNNFYGANYLDGWGMWRSLMYTWLDQGAKP